ncbi:N-alpha-acetyltransferase 16, NatA auxiliary subunit [Hypsibius exemplaris]|uniref:N-alpha-acetyltransferase 16, NatA auxiliary subunit n=1 Tax=Hypsibius exemplaris TaxID=2072580 RepID=A0A9X6RJG0_HYPEX|nr:N-alpha-acetyltransferase 16, NatA auxiliary subunit [Hypsibius exemplaris]
MTGVAENHNTSLPPKEAGLFKRLLKMYEQKQYKMALKIAKQILSNPKLADHGETLAMKGLTLSYMGRKEEAYEDVKRGLKSDLKSYVCWHVYGLIQRGDKKYEEAMKCYVNALKIDKDNIQILRDLATLQVQLRDLEGFRDTRYRLAVLRPSQRSHWLAYAVALHLQGELPLAIKVMEECRKLAHPEKREDCDVEYGEYILYQLELMMEAGSFPEAIEHSLRYESYVFDNVSLLENRVKAYLASGKKKEANEILFTLLDRNAENWKYYQDLSFPTDSAENLLEFCKEMQKSKPSARTPKKIPLTLTQGDEFRILVRSYLTQGLQKGLPALFNDIKLLYKEPSKASIIEEEVFKILDMEKSRSSQVSPQTSSDEDLPASTLLWTYYFLAQHSDQKRDYIKALEYVDLAIEHTPTLVESYSFKAKIYKHMNRLVEAADCMDEAQSLDTSDRFINYKTGKYLLRANLVDRAETILAKFTREGMKASENLCDMQCFWYMIESARALNRLGKVGEALKILHVIDRHFMDIVDDQLDFHAYCLRKSTIRSYVALIRLEDSVRQHKFYVNAAVLAAEIYLQLSEKQPTDSDDDGINDPSMSAADKKKLKNKQRKAKKKADSERIQQEAAEKAKAHTKVKKDDDEPAAAQKEDLVPEKLAKPEDPLEQACHFLRPLLVLDIPHFDLHRVIFDVYQRKGKYAIAVRSLLRMMSLQPNHPKVAECRTVCLDFENTVNGVPSAIQEVTQEALLAIKQFVPV